MQHGLAPGHDVLEEAPKEAPRYRDIAWGVALTIGVLAVITWLWLRGAASLDFEFFGQPAGFDISQTPIAYSTSGSTYGRAFVVGLINTLLVAVLGVVFATILGFLVGIARLSSNWLLARLAGVYVEAIRNVPLLLHLLFWYSVVLTTLPEFRDSVALPGGGFLNNRGLFLPRPVSEGGFGDVGLALLAGVALAIIAALALKRAAPDIARWRRVVILMLAVIGPVLAAWWLAVGPVSYELPEIGRFNMRGGVEILPEFVALLIGLSLYTAAFIAEVVRAGLKSVPHGQVEAASALGLTRAAALRRVIVPQAIQVILPPLTNQYLNLTKNSSLAVAIGYPDLVQIFTGTVLNQTGRAIEIVIVTMAVYLVISLATSGVMNLYNARLGAAQRR